MNTSELYKLKLYLLHYLTKCNLYYRETTGICLGNRITKGNGPLHTHTGHLVCLLSITFYTSTLSSDKLG